MSQHQNKYLHNLVLLSLLNFINVVFEMAYIIDEIVTSLFCLIFNFPVLLITTTIELKFQICVLKINRSLLNVQRIANIKTPFITV